MRTNVALTIGAGVVGFAFAAYMFTYATERREPVEWRNGDLVFQTATALPNKMILDATLSTLTNVGIVAVTENGPTVISVRDEVDEVPMRSFVAKGADRTITVYRLRNIAPEYGVRVVEAARRYVGKPYDVFFDKSADEIYAAELVRLAFSEIGVLLGDWEKLERLAKRQPGFESIYAQRSSDIRVCRSRNLDYKQCWAHLLKQQVVTPASIAADKHLEQIYSDRPSAQARAPE
jgi:hypothetical protein